MRRATGLLFLIIMTLSLVLGACGGGASASNAAAVNRVSLTLVPAEAAFLVTARGDKLVNDPQIKSLTQRITEVAGQDVGSRLGISSADALCAFNLSPRFITSFGVLPGKGTPILDSNGNPVEATTASATIAEGPYDKAHVLKCFLGPDGKAPKAVPYKGVDIYQAVSAGKSLSVAFLTESIYVTGTPQLVVSIIEVHKGEKSALRGPMVRYHDQRDSALLKMSLASIGELIGQQAGDDTEIPGVLKEITSITLTLEKARRNFILKAKVELPTREEAQNTKKLVDGLLAFASLAGSNADADKDDKAMLALVKRVRGSISGSSYILSFTFSAGDVERLVESGHATLGGSDEKE